MMNEIFRNTVGSILGGKMRNTFGHSCDITFETIADLAKNTEGYITVPSLHTSEIASV